MKIKNNLYEEILSSNELNEKEKAVLRALIITKSVDETIFITNATIDEIAKVYNVWQENNVNNLGMEENVNLKENISEDKAKTQIDRQAALEYVKKKLLQHNNNLKITSKKYNDLNGTLNVNGNKRNIKIKIKASKNFNKKTVGAWHKENPELIDSYDYHVYIVEDDTNDSNYQYRTLIFSTSELNIKLLSQKVYKDNMVNYYFNWDSSNNTVVDLRENTAKNNHIIDVSFADADTNQKWKL